MFKNNRNLLIIALIALVNSLGYGIIIPILYSYSMTYGLTDFQNGMLFALFSLCQFITTPFIGRLSDKYGRKPVLAISVIGTAISFFMMAFAPNALILFIARALDGITAGNIPVASAVISDSTRPQDRARGFGIIAGSFGFGLVFGPAIAALTLPFGISTPFIIAGGISLLAAILTIVFLPETNKHLGRVVKGKVFDVKKFATAIFDENTGSTLLMTLIYFSAFGLFIFAFQPFAVRVLNLSPTTISLVYTLYGSVGLVSQLFLIPRIVKRFGERRSLLFAYSLISAGFLGMFFVHILPLFLLISIVFSFAHGFVMPLIQTILSKETSAESQGSVLGLNSSYQSIGNVLGPVIGGFLATFYVPLPFLLGCSLVIICLFVGIRTLKDVYTHKESTF